MDSKNLQKVFDACHVDKSRQTMKLISARSSNSNPLAVSGVIIIEGSISNEQERK